LEESDDIHFCTVLRDLGLAFFEYIYFLEFTIVNLFFF
jgi:hypothetical protein